LATLIFSAIFVYVRLRYLLFDLVESERRDVIRWWEKNQEDCRLIKHALALYSGVEAARE
jgi:hypothetical protein